MIAVVTLWTLRCPIPMDTPEFSLKVNGFTPGTIPMGRLADYMAAFAKLLGSPDSVHFVRVAEGSAQLISNVNEQDQPKVTRRLELVRYGGGTLEARAAYQKIDDMLVEDATDASVLKGDTNLIMFPGKARPTQITFGPVVQEDTIDGVLISLGGKDDTVPIHLSDGNTVFKCNTTRTMARSMASFIFGPMLRVYGTASWRRDADSLWRLNTMTITDFKELNDDPATDVIARLRAILGNTWSDLDDPYALLEELRNGD